MQTDRRSDHGKSGSLRPDVGRITCGSGVCVGMPAVLRAGRLLLDRSHLTRPISIQLWTTSFPVYDDGSPQHPLTQPVLHTFRMHAGGRRQHAGPGPSLRLAADERWPVFATVRTFDLAGT